MGSEFLFAYIKYDKRTQVLNIQSICPGVPNDQKIKFSNFYRLFYINLGLVKVFLKAVNL